MESKGNYFKKWLGFDRRERRASSILLLIVLLVFLSRYLVPGKPAEIKNITAEISGYRPLIPISIDVLADSLVLFTFDPNSAALKDFVALGLTEKQANTIINYRKAGGKFYYPSDMSKIYGIPQTKIDQLLPYIIIGGSVKTKKSGLQPKKTIVLDLNASDSIMLDMLPGIGPVFASRIIKYRNLLGGYSNREQLTEVYGLTAETFSLIKERVYADSLDVSKIIINKATYSDLIRHPYFETADVSSVLKFRELNGNIENMHDLISNKILTPEKAKKISPYLSFE